MKPQLRVTPPLEDLVPVALRLIDEHGLGEFSMRRLSAEVGVFVNVLYRRCASKEHLLDLVADAVLAEVALPADDIPPREWLHAVGLDLRSAVRRHPHVAGLINASSRGRQSSARLTDAVLRTLSRADLDVEGQLGAAAAYYGFVLGTALLEGGRHRGPEPAPDLVLDDLPHLAAARDHVRAALAQGDDVDAMSDRGFAAGLDAVLRAVLPQLVAASPQEIAAGLRRPATRRPGSARHRLN